MPYVKDLGKGFEFFDAIMQMPLKYTYSPTLYNYYDIDPSTLCQCTGKKVKNGFLCEGDWIYDDYGPMISICVWTEEGFKWKTHEGMDINNYDNESFQIEELDEIVLSLVEIKGNIHDNER